MHFYYDMAENILIINLKDKNIESTTYFSFKKANFFENNIIICQFTSRRQWYLTSGSFIDITKDDAKQFYSDFI